MLQTTHGGGGRGGMPQLLHRRRAEPRRNLPRVRGGDEEAETCGTAGRPCRRRARGADIPRAAEGAGNPGPGRLPRKSGSSRSMPHRCGNFRAIMESAATHVAAAWQRRSHVPTR